MKKDKILLFGFLTIFIIILGTTIVSAITIPSKPSSEKNVKL